MIVIIPYFYFLKNNNNTDQCNPQILEISNIKVNVKVDFPLIKLIKAIAVSKALKYIFPVGKLCGCLGLEVCKETNAKWEVTLYKTGEECL